MLKGLLAGLMAGALITAVSLKALAAKRAAGFDRADRAAAGAPDPAALKAQADGLRAANEDLRRTIESRKAELAALEAKKAPATAKKKKKKAGEKTWKELAPLLARSFGGDGDERDKDEVQAAQLDFMALAARIAKKYGITIDEAMSSPDGLPQLLRALLETGTPPATPEQLARLDRLIESYAKDWEKVRGGSEGDSRLEQKLAIGELCDAYIENVLGTMSSEQLAANKNFEMFSGMSDGMGGSHYANGKRDAVVADLSAQWSKIMKLDDAQKAQLGPYVEAFMADYEAARSSVRAEGPQDPTVWKKIAREQVRAQIRAQKAIAAGLSLTPAQQKALLSSPVTFQFWVDSSQPPPEPAPGEGEGQ